MQQIDKPIPVTVLTGFLGAGKTTMLRRILSEPSGRKYGVLVNDFGEINIDAALIVESDTDRISLSNGCVCCSIQNELADAVSALVESRPELDGIIIEASGVSRSIPLADVLTADELRNKVKLDGMFCVVDAASFPELDYVSTELAIDQITGADFIVLNKADLVSESDLEKVVVRLKGVMPHIRCVPTTQGVIPTELLFDLQRETPAHNCGDHPGHPCDCSHHHDHGEEHDHTSAFASWSWRSTAPLDEACLRASLRKLNPTLLRAKGVLHVARAEGTRLFEFQQVGKRSTLKEIENAQTRDSVLVAIGLKDQIDAERLTQLLDSCTLETTT